MAKEFFKNLPDKTTPLTASRINGLLNGKESMGSIVVEDIQCKNLYNPDNARASGGSLQNCDNTIYLQPNTNYVFKSNHTWTQVRLYNSSGVETRSIGGDREDITEISFATTSDEVKGLFIFYVGDYFNINELDFTGIQLEKGTVATPYTPHKEFSNKQIYSTNEQVIGTWIDGKPLYEKTIEIGSVELNAWNEINTNISNINLAFVKNAFIILGGINTRPIMEAEPTKSGTGVQIGKDGKLYIYATNVLGDVTGAYVTIDYTKTTD